MPDDHSEVVPLLPIPNRTVKRLCADDSADSRVKVGHRQAVIRERAQQNAGPFLPQVSQPLCEPGVFSSALSERVLMRALKSVLEFKASLIAASKSETTSKQAGGKKV